MSEIGAWVAGIGYIGEAHSIAQKEIGGFLKAIETEKPV